jgi:hypothetical protein
MALDSPLAPETGPVEPPSQYAELVVQFGPAQPWGTARGKVPPAQAHHFIATFGIVASVIAGIAGTVLTLRIAPGLTGPAYAELGLAFGAAVLIAVRRAASRSGRSRELPGTRNRPAIQEGRESETMAGAAPPDP